MNATEKQLLYLPGGVEYQTNFSKSFWCILMTLKLSKEECFTEFSDEREGYFLLLANCTFLHESRLSNISAPIFIYFCGT